MKDWIDLFEEHHLVVTNFELFVSYLLFGWWGIFLRITFSTWILWGEFDDLNELIEFFTPKKKSVLLIVLPWVLVFLKNQSTARIIN